MQNVSFAAVPGIHYYMKRPYPFGHGLVCVGITWLPGKCNVLSCRCDSPVDCRRHPLSYEETVSKRIRSDLCWHYLSSRQVTLQVLSAQMSLTSVFGMGTGGPSSQSIPTILDGCYTIIYVKTLAQVLTAFV